MAESLEQGDTPTRVRPADPEKQAKLGNNGRASTTLSGDRLPASGSRRQKELGGDGEGCGPILGRARHLPSCENTDLSLSRFSREAGNPNSSEKSPNS